MVSRSVSPAAPASATLVDKARREAEQLGVSFDFATPKVVRAIIQASADGRHRLHLEVPLDQVRPATFGMRLRTAMANGFVPALTFSSGEAVDVKVKGTPARLVVDAPTVADQALLTHAGQLRLEFRHPSKPAFALSLQLGEVVLDRSGVTKGQLAVDRARHADLLDELKRAIEPARKLDAMDQSARLAAAERLTSTQAAVDSTVSELRATAAAAPIESVIETLRTVSRLDLTAVARLEAARSAERSIPEAKREVETVVTELERVGVTAEQERAKLPAFDDALASARRERLGAEGVLRAALNNLAGEQHWLVFERVSGRPPALPSLVEQRDTARAEQRALSHSAPLQQEALIGRLISEERGRVEHLDVLLATPPSGDLFTTNVKDAGGDAELRRLFQLRPEQTWASWREERLRQNESPFSTGR